MHKFTFDKKEQKLLTVEINGIKFVFNPHTLQTKTSSEKFIKCQKPLVGKLKQKDISQKELDDIVMKSCALVRNTVNDILGKKAYERIFAGRTVDFEEHQKLITFLFEEITAFSNDNHESVA